MRHVSIKIDEFQYICMCVHVYLCVHLHLCLCVSVCVCGCKSRRQHPTKQQLYGHLPPIMKSIQVWQTRHVGHCLRSKDKLRSDILLWTLSHRQAKVGRSAKTYLQQSVLIQEATWRIYQEQWTIETGGEIGSGKSMLSVWHDDDDDDVYIYILMWVHVYVWRYSWINILFKNTFSWKK